MDEYLTKLTQKAESGDLEAMVELGHSLGRASAEALKWFERAAAKSYGPALNALGWGFEKGYYGLTIDIAKAAEFYRRAVAAGETTLGPLKLAAHAKKLAAKAAKLAKGTADPIRDLLAELKLTKHKDVILAAQRPSIRWVAKSAKGEIDGSRLGGLPLLPKGVVWPTANGRSLEHVATLDFAGVPAVAEVMPNGTLIFFCDAENLPMGDDQVGWAVIHVEPGTAVSKVKAPKGIKVLGSSRLEPVVEATLPSPGLTAWKSLGLPKSAYDRYLELLDAWPLSKGERHRSFGHADMAEDGPDEDPVLLLQVDSYDAGPIYWGDGGRIYFWIDAGDLAAQRYERARFQLVG